MWGLLTQFCNCLNFSWSGQCDKISWDNWRFRLWLAMPNRNNLKADCTFLILCSKLTRRIWLSNELLARFAYFIIKPIENSFKKPSKPPNRFAAQRNFSPIISNCFSCFSPLLLQRDQLSNGKVLSWMNYYLLSTRKDEYIKEICKNSWTREKWSSLIILGDFFWIFTCLWTESNEMEGKVMDVERQVSFWCL